MVHLRSAGFKVDARNVSSISLETAKDENGVPPGLRTCHTARVGDYVIEGHVPAEVIHRLLREKPDVKGIGVPGMPVGSPGMEGPGARLYTVYSYDRDGRTRVYQQVNP
ncbi:MAG: hypothetical protein HYZ11_17380 [Candidatus Tectomicrobia bacterium]|uniref:CopG family transcriptional regulator n=1 Tax=Tectimicrobiota bacterium TaxID=2528274 RepID=A0A932MP52_UNCTE|nr:hypothetical protein [Candidatus Tectomicrobia bacterium]